MKKKALVIVVGMMGLAAAMKVFGPKMQGIDWEKRFEQMPDTAPPKWMFTNIKAIRENTDRILALLERDRPGDTRSTTAVLTAAGTSAEHRDDT